VALDIYSEEYLVCKKTNIERNTHETEGKELKLIIR
jgi:hypothetical protein